MKNQKHVVECAGEYSAVKSIQQDGIEDVYCLNVPNKGNFLVNDGIVVKNCLDALRYCLFSHYYNKEFGEISAERLDNLYNETRGIQSDLPSFFQQPIDGPRGGF